MFFQNLAPTVKSISLVEDDDYFYELLENWPRVQTKKFATDMAILSHKIENFSVALRIEALDYFRSYEVFLAEKDKSDRAALPPSRLETLALTSDALAPDSPSAVSKLLCAAANAAGCMPKLQIMELWNGSPDWFAIFRYERDRDGNATLTWHASWNPWCLPKVIEVWEKVAVENHGCSRVKVDEIYTFAPPVVPLAVAQHLRLRKRVVHPLSLYQIQREVEATYDDLAWMASYHIP